MTTSYYRSSTIAAGALGGFIFGFALGAALMYMLDPVAGTRRRALARDKARSYTRHTRRMVARQARHGRDRMKGWVANAKSAIWHESVDDDLLRERVRAALGRVVSHAGPIEVIASQGVVTICGPILTDEADSLIRRVAGVRGVHEVIDNRECHDQPGSVPGLQR